MIKVMLVLLFWMGVAGYISLSLDGVIMGQSLVTEYLRNVPFKTLPTTNGMLLGILAMAAVFFSLAWLQAD